MADALPLSGRKCVVTGGSRGIGAAVVRMVLAQGADVAFGYHHSSDRAEALRDELRTAYPEQRCTALPGEVSDGAGAEKFAAEALKSLGGGLDVLVNNAGITRDISFARMRREQWDEVIDTNLGSMFNVTRPLVMPLVKQRNGTVINITSASGIHGAPGQTAYSASKSGIIGFTKALAKEVGGLGVTVNAVAPGFIHTDMTAAIPEQHADRLKSMIPTQEFGSADDVAALVCFLASDRARYITGQVIEISGGLVL
ncbi:SDR family oxidoreductase [Streptomyces sp. NRRL B-1677]|uniref:SDR family oxidoreductase n=2 Tax=Streptomyces TaxID=1883 RepID=A0A3B0BYQ7_9ACTN|nr:MULTISPECIES: 3-oxoacyl-ACP reductase FabG [Streptomyces]MBF6049633.1 SDR family oxidoreductase [Streptomyces sp. NRRL B-1677]RKN77561.1 SDR family oxidoreductase [Streptomyces klenkii]BAO98807.1 putative ketoreductase [Streptomyces roseoverticillatus]